MAEVEGVGERSCVLLIEFPSDSKLPKMTERYPLGRDQISRGDGVGKEDLEPRNIDLKMLESLVCGLKKTCGARQIRFHEARNLCAKALKGFANMHRLKSQFVKNVFNKTTKSGHPEHS